VNWHGLSKWHTVGAVRCPVPYDAQALSSITTALLNFECHFQQSTQRRLWYLQCYVTDYTVQPNDFERCTYCGRQSAWSVLACCRWSQSSLMLLRKKP